MTKQQTFPGMESAVQVAVDDWREAKRECRRVREVRDIKHAQLLAVLQEHALDEFCYIDELTGKKRRVRVVTETKVKDGMAPRIVETEEVEDETDDAEAKVDDKVEKRKVSRASVAAEIDPFEATRAGLDA